MERRMHGCTHNYSSSYDMGVACSIVCGVDAFISYLSSADLTQQPFRRLKLGPETESRVQRQRCIWNQINIDIKQDEPLIIFIHARRNLPSNHLRKNCF